VPDGGPTFEHYYFTLEAAVAGLGVAIAPWHLVMDDIRAGRLVAPLGFDESAYQYVARGAAMPMRGWTPFAAGWSSRRVRCRALICPLIPANPPETPPSALNR
jgi:LysR family glycine cleavage system transcriptional activator